jgi:dehydrogenase/reductase SDR family protein 4
MEASILTSKRYANKVCLVTGATMGIGYSIAEQFGLEGATVIICSRKDTNVKKAENDLKSKGIAVDAFICNINSKDERKKMLQSIKDKYNRLDVLVSNVAVNPYFGASMDMTEDAFDKIFEVNVKNTFFLIKECLPLLKSTKNSNVLIISSQVGYTPFPMIGVYSMSKTCLLSMTKLLGEELAKFGIRVNSIAPGVINTKFAKALIENELGSGNFLKRPGVPKEIGLAAAFVCSDEASFITGENICINGGMHGRL